MGREALVLAHWRGAMEEVKALLEAREIILRGAIKARIPRAGISRVAIDGGKLLVWADSEQLVLELGAVEATKWRDALLSLPSSLASKLGIGPEKPAFVMGLPNDPVLAAALAGSVSPSPDTAYILIAVTTGESDLAAALAVAAAHPRRLLWCIYEKGKTAQFGDTAIRSFMRNHGYIDSKSCAVSDRLTATRYGPMAGAVRS